jgi:hypothetical protein
VGKNKKEAGGPDSVGKLKKKEKAPGVRACGPRTRRAAESASSSARAVEREEGDDGRAPPVRERGKKKKKRRGWVGLV